MATPKSKGKGALSGATMKTLLGKASAGPMGEGGGEPDAEEASEPEPGDPEAEHKAAFKEMCAAIRDGDDDAAYKAYQECQELG